MEFLFENLVLRSSAKEDLDFILKLESHSENSKFITGWSAEKHLSAQSNEDFCHSMILSDSKVVGFVILAGLKNSHRSIEFMRIVVAEKEKGVGRKAVRAVKKLCFDKLNAHRLWLDVKTFNERAKYLYTSEGFKTEGILRDCIKTDRGFESLAVLSILESEYR